MASAGNLLKNTFKGIGKALLFVVKLLGRLSPVGLVAGAAMLGKEVWDNKENLSEFGKEKLQSLANVWS